MRHNCVRTNGFNRLCGSLFRNVRKDGEIVEQKVSIALIGSLFRNDPIQLYVVTVDVSIALIGSLFRNKFAQCIVAELVRFNRLNWLLIPQHRFQNWGEKLVYVSIALIGSLFRNAPAPEQGTNWYVSIALIGSLFRNSVYTADRHSRNKFQSP